MREYFKINNKTVGYIEGKIYYSYREVDKHLLRIHQSYGISVVIVRKLVSRSINDIRFISKEKRGIITYKTSLYNLLQKGIVWYDGRDKQYHMPLKKMEVLK